MPECVSCKREYQVASGGKPASRLCPACLQAKLRGTWKRQMRYYGLSIIAGLLILIYVYLAVKGHGGGMGQGMQALMALGGLGLMGGLFGLALAVFFHLWHRKK